MNKYIGNIRYTYLIAVCLLLFTSCKKEMETTTIGEEAILSFTIAGVQDQNEVNVKLGSINPLNEGESSNKIVTSANLADGIILETASSTEKMESILEKNTNLSEGIKSKIQNKLAATSKMETGKTYRVILRNATTNVIERNVIATVGTALEIAVQKDVNYNWYAFSFNNDDQNLPFDVTNFRVETSATTDLLFAQGTAVVSSNTPNKPLPITFKHKVAMVNIEIEASGMSSDINDIEAEFVESDYFNTGTINLFDGNQTGPLVTQNITNIIFSQKTNSNWSAKYYTANPTSITSNLEVDIKKLLVTKHVNNSQIDLTTLISNSLNPVSFNFPTSGKAVGNKLNATLHLINRLHQLRILHVDKQLNVTNGLIEGRTGVPSDISPHNLLWNDEYGFGSNLNVNNWQGFPAFLRRTFTVANGFIKEPILPNHPTVNYFDHIPGDGSIPMKGSLISKVSLNHEGDIANSIPANPTNSNPDPDVVIISLLGGYFSKADNDRLNAYVNDRNGIVILLADRDSPLSFGQGYNDTSTRHLTILPFIKEQFSSPNATTIPQFFPGNTFPIYKFKNNINDRIINGYSGNVRNKNWSPGYDNVRGVVGTNNHENGANTLLFTGLNASYVIDYSDVDPLNVPSPETNGRSLHTSIIFRHATKNIFIFGDANFAQTTIIRDGSGQPIYYEQPYRLDSFQSYFQPYIWPYADRFNYPATFKPITVKNYKNTVYDVDNATFMGNLIVYALLQASAKYNP